MRRFTIPALAAAAVAVAGLLTPVAAQTYNDYPNYNNNHSYNGQYPSTTQRYGQGNYDRDQNNSGQQQRSYGQDNYGQNYRSYGREDNGRNNRRENYGRNDDSDRYGRNQQSYGSRNNNNPRFDNGQYGLGRSYNPGSNNRGNSEDDD